MTVDQVGERYVSLALHLDRHISGFVDAYFGPQELRDGILDAEPRALDALAHDVVDLQTAIEAGIEDPHRKEFLSGQVRAMQTLIRKLSCEQLDYEEEVQLCFDISPQMVDEAAFKMAHTEMADILPPGGTLTERLAAWNKTLEIESDKLLSVFDRARQEIRSRTRALLDLPPGEDVSLTVVTDKPWGAYNWYLGNYQSRIDINTDLPLRISSVVPLLAHEAYPGHHSELALKEYHLYRRCGRAEHAVQLLLAPESVVSEGIADMARAMIFDDEDLAFFLSQELHPLAGLPDEKVEQQIRLVRAGQNLRGVGGNAALLLHRDRLPPDEVQKYIEQYGLLTPREAAQRMRFIQNELLRAYVFTYAYGRRLLNPLLVGEDAGSNFQRLLAEPFTPSMIRDWQAWS